MDRKCAAGYIGQIWAVDTLWLEEATARFREGALVEVRAEGEAPAELSGVVEVAAAAGGEEPAYTMTGDGIAIIEMVGHTMKRDSKFGGTSTIRTRRALRAAASDPAVMGIMLLIDSPGGTVAGTAALGEDIRAARAEKPVFAHIDDMGASAAYWIASQAAKVTATTGSKVGSIGIFTVLYDTSKALEARGIKVHFIASGEFKAAGGDGTEITEKDLEYFHEIVQETHALFIEQVAKGRGVTLKKAEAWGNGRVWGAGKAEELGLLDGVMSFDRALKGLWREARPKRRMRAEIAGRRIEASGKSMGGGSVGSGR